MRSTISAVAFGLIAIASASSGCGAMMANLTGHHTYADDAPANAFVKSQQGKIVFSTKDIPHDVSSANDLATEFNLDQPIWWRPFYAHSPYNSILAAGEKCHQANHDYIVQARNADGPPDKWDVLTGNPQNMADKAYVSWITMGQDPLLGKGPKEERSTGLATRTLAYLLKLPRGKINVELRYLISCDAPNPKDPSQSVRQDPIELARGTLQINVTEDAVAQYVKANGITMESVAFAHADDRKRIETEARSMVEGKPVVAFFMRQRDWNVVRDDFNRVIRRTADGTIVVRDGNSCLGFDFTALEDNMGGSKFVDTPVLSDARFSGKPSGNPIPCSAIPKSIK